MGWPSQRKPASFATKGRTSQKLVDELNSEMGVSKAQAAAMLEPLCGGGDFGDTSSELGNGGPDLRLPPQGWATPAADPKNYDEQGQPIKTRRHDRGDAR